MIFVLKWPVFVDIVLTDPKISTKTFFGLLTPGFLTHLFSCNPAARLGACEVARSAWPSSCKIPRRYLWNGSGSSVANDNPRGFCGRTWSRNGWIFYKIILVYWIFITGSSTLDISYIYIYIHIYIFIKWFSGGYVETTWPLYWRAFGDHLSQPGHLAARYVARKRSPPSTHKNGGFTP